METFKDKGLNDEILKAIGELGFETPTPIQDKTIPAILESMGDIIALAQTGTGKTAGFGLPILQQIDTKKRKVQSLILSPTRELCIQIAKDLKNYAKYIPGLRVEAVYGGASIVPQLNALRDGCQVIVGTPGRTLDLIKRKALKVENVNWMVLDEADEMLNMGFKDELDGILENTPEGKQTLLFSATMPQGVRRIAENYMSDIKEISVGKKNQGASTVSHEYFVVRASDRYAALKRLADIHPDIYAIVFCRTRRETKDVADKLIQDGYSADALHGDLSQQQRDHVMGRFRSNHLQILVATDVAARGIDINELTHVINFQLPDDPEVYVHRSGRTGRAGNKGISFTITHSREGRKIKELERVIGQKFELKQIPSGSEICERRLFSLMEKVKNIDVDTTQIEKFLPKIIESFDGIAPEEILKRFISVEFNRFLEYYKRAPDLNVNGDRDSRDSRDSRDGRDRDGKKSRSASGFSRFHINLGSKHNINASTLIGLINDATSTNNIEVGKIDLMRNFSFFEVDKAHEKTIISSFENAEADGVKLIVQLSKPDASERQGSRKPRDSRGGSERSGGSRSGGSRSGGDRSGSGERSGYKGSGKKEWGNDSSNRGKRKPKSGDREKKRY